MCLPKVEKIKTPDTTPAPPAPAAGAPEAASLEATNSDSNTLKIKRSGRNALKIPLTSPSTGLYIPPA